MACGASDQSASLPAPVVLVTSGATHKAPAAPPSSAPATTQPTSQLTIPPSTALQLVPPTAGPRPSPAHQPPRPPKPTTPPAAATTAVAGAWPTYHNQQAGFQIAYPPDWAVSERGGEDGAFITAFMPPDAGPGITVAVQAGAPPSIEPSENDTRRCERVVVARLTGTRCFDTATATISTTLAGKGKTYIIATTGKGLDDSLYQRLLDSFAPF